MKYLMGKNPMNRFVAAIFFTLATGVLIGASCAAMDCENAKLAKMCGIFSVIIFPLVVFYWITIFKTVIIKDKLTVMREKMQKDEEGDFGTHNIQFREG